MVAQYQLVGLGTYKLQDDLCTQIIKSGLELGYRQIDTAQLYHNHEYIAMGITQSCIPRTDLFIQSKIHNSNIRKLKISESVEQIKKELNTDYLDLILLHNPVKNYDKAWEELVRSQSHLNIRYIGVSNFDIEHLDNIISSTGIIPWLNQIELNIFNQQTKLIEYNKSKQIITQSHTTLTKSSLLDDKKLGLFANQLDVTVPELMFRYVLEQEIGILPRTSNFEHLVLNYNKTKNILSNPIIDYSNIDLINFDIGYKIY